MPEVRARLVDGQPVLQLLDESDASVRMAWPLPRDESASTELRELFRALFLAAARERLSHGRLHHRRRASQTSG